MLLSHDIGSEAKRFYDTRQNFDVEEYFPDEYKFDVLLSALKLAPKGGIIQFYYTQNVFT